MLRKCVLFSIIGFVVLLVACSKNTSRPDAANSSALVGNYQFLYLTTNINLTEDASILGQTTRLFVVTTGYKTTQNTGTAIFTKDSVIGKDIGYSYNAAATTTFYVNGVASDSTTSSESGSVPPTSSTAKYQLIGTDSIYFPGGALGLDGALAGSPVPVAPPTGGHYVIKGDTLTITTRINQSFPDNVNGIPTTATAAFIGTIVLKKQ